MESKKKKRYKWTYLQNRNSFKDLENKLVVARGKVRGKEFEVNRYTECWVSAWSLSRVWLFVTPWTISLPDSFVHGILQARILEWVAISFSRGSSPSRDWSQVFCIAGGSLLSELPGKPKIHTTIYKIINNELMYSIGNLHLVVTF